MATSRGDRRSQRILARRCAHCGEVFEPARPGQRFCKPSCRRAHFYSPREQPRLPLGELDALFDEAFEE